MSLVFSLGILTSCSTWQIASPTTLPKPESRVRIWDHGEIYVGRVYRSRCDTVTVLVDGATNGCLGCLRHFSVQGVDRMMVFQSDPTTTAVGAIGAAVLTGILLNYEGP